MSRWHHLGCGFHAYDNAGNLTGISHKGSFSAFATYAYSYDAANRLTSEIINGSQRTYSYDVTDQLTNDAGTNYSYDGNGNRTMSGYATDPGNRIKNDGVWTYTYDAEGNVTRKSKGTASDTWTYGYDNRNQMATAAFAVTDGGSVTQRVTYVYDAFGNRIERDAWDGSTATVERFGLDGWDPGKPQPVGNELELQSLHINQYNVARRGSYQNRGPTSQGQDRLDNPIDCYRNFNGRLIA